VSTPDLAATTAKAKKLGGSVLMEMPVPTVGSFAILKDPQGAVFAAFQPEGDAPGHDGDAALGEFAWHELTTLDWKGAWSFYSDLFDWRQMDQMDMGDMGMYHIGAAKAGGSAACTTSRPKCRCPRGCFTSR
jgi:predicted enzyme related to lactoylglutathione lyase